MDDATIVTAGSPAPDRPRGPRAPTLLDALLPIVVRLARRLLILAEGHGDLDAKERTITLKQEQLAQEAVINAKADKLLAQEEV